MKNKYVAPSMLTIRIGTMHIIAESLAINRDGDRITNSNQILVKENSNANNQSVWDEEW